MDGPAWRRNPEYRNRYELAVFKVDTADLLIPNQKATIMSAAQQLEKQGMEY